jgi:hypothetical protein
MDKLSARGRVAQALVGVAALVVLALLTGSAPRDRRAT